MTAKDLAACGGHQAIVSMLAKRAAKVLKGLLRAPKGHSLRSFTSQIGRAGDPKHVGLRAFPKETQCAKGVGAPWREVPGEDQHHSYGALLKMMEKPLVAGAQSLRPADLALIGQSKWGLHAETCAW